MIRSQIGTQIKSLKFFEPILSQVMQRLVKHTRFRSRPGLAEILESHPRLVIVFNHAAPLSWLPAIALLTSHACAKGGGARRPTGVMDRFFFAVPGLRVLVHQLTQSDHPLGFHELIAKFKSSVGTDIVIFPEGSNCFFGHPENVQPFRSPRFVELAIRSETPILLCAHRGSESWAKVVNVDPVWLSKIDVLPKVVSHFLTDRLHQTGLFSIPLWPKALDHFEMMCEVYHPTLTLKDLSADQETADAQVRAESDLVHAKFKSMLQEIDQGVLASEIDSSTPNS